MRVAKSTSDRSFAQSSTLSAAIRLTLAVALFAAFLPLNAQTPAAAGALERGYRTGYTDGYQSGWKDSLDNAQRNLRNKEDYARADRGYIVAYGELKDYRDGYRQGYEVGYEAGYTRAGFNSNVPANLSRRGIGNESAPPATSDAASSANNATNGAASNSTNGAPLSHIPAETEFRIQLLSSLSSEASQSGDSFTARVVEPAEYAGAIITGRVVSVRRAGKLTGEARMQLSFQTIKLPDGRTSDFSAQVVQVSESKQNNVGKVDSEGGVRGRGTTKDDVTKIGGGAGIGAVVGSIADGGKGAVIGAVVGAVVGVGGVLIGRGRDIRLEPGQQMTIRSANEARVAQN